MRPDDANGPTGDERDEPSGSEAPREPDSPPPATWAGRERVRGPDDEGGAEPQTDESAEGEASQEHVEDAGDQSDERAEGAGDEGDERTEGAGDERDERAEGAGDEGEERAGGATSQETVEAETLALGDREEAEEAALAGLKARAAEYAAKREAEGQATAAGPAAEEGAAAPEPAPAAEPEAPAAAEPAGEAPRARALWARFLAASLLIVISTATATSVSLLLVLTDLAQGLGGIRGVERQLSPVGGGDPQTILILGSDERPDHPVQLSDTAILLRVDPDRGAIGLLSIPRDLRVNIPGVGVAKFNQAYAQGGPRRTLRVVKQLTDLEINHVVNINFTGFADAVNAIDCVFVDVDRRYFIPPEADIAEIDIEAGYQRLCGLKALQYVRFRHDDNDLVRAARQQDFLREARQKIPPSKLWSDRKDLIGIFKEYTTSDQGLEDPIQLLELLKTFLGARNATVNEIHFPAQLGDADSPYVTANQKEIRDTVEEFLGVEGTPGPKPGSTQRGGGKGKGQRAKGDSGQGKKRDSGPAMIEAPLARDYAQIIADTTTQGGKRRIDFPVYYPTEAPAETTFNPIDASRAFPIDGPGKEVYEGYKLVFGIPGSAGFTEFWGVSGTNWPDPPILENPSETRDIDGREYLLFYDGDRLRLVGWKQRRTSYWVNNTLLQSLEESEMLAIARSMRELGG